MRSAELEEKYAEAGGVVVQSSTGSARPPSSAPATGFSLDELAHLLPRNIKRQQEIKEQLRCWWLAAKGRANTPNWDIASTCTIKGKPGLLLIEAKAHVNELSPRGKIPPKASASDDSQKNHEQICRAIAQANAL